MTNLDWYERVVDNVSQVLFDECEIAKDLLLAGQFQIYTSKLEKHPTLSVVLSFTNGEYTEEPIVIHFDPYNQEFYTLVPEEDVTLRLMLNDSDEITGFIHEQIHIAYLAHQNHEMLMELDGNETDPFHGFVEMMNSIASGHAPHFMPNDQYPHEEYSTDEELAYENLANGEIEWFPKNIVTESLTKEDEQLQKVTSIRIGKFANTETFVLGRVDSTTINGEFEGEQAAIFPFKQDEIAALKEVLKIL